MKNLNFKLKYSCLFAVLVLFSASLIVSCEREGDYTIDRANPVVVSYNPVSGVDGVSLNSNLVLTFDEIVEKGKGSITITTDSEDAKQIIDINSDAVTIDNDARVVTINPSDFISGANYQVVLDRGIVKDILGNEYFGMPTDISWSFTSGGNSGPQLSELTPADDEAEGSLFTLVLRFVDNVKKGEGNIVIYDASDVVVATIPIDAQKVTLDGNMLTILLEEPLEFASDYYVNIDKGAITDIAGADFAGFSDKTSWNYTTTAGSGSDLIVYLSLDESFADVSGNKFDAMLGSTATSEVEFVEDETRGKVVKFNAGSFAQLPRHDLLRPSETQDFSCNMWFKFPGIGSDPAIFSNSSWDSGGNPGILLCIDDGDTYQLGTDGTGWLVNLAGDPKADGNRMDWKAGKTTPQAPALSDDNWHMASIVLDQTNKTLHVYIDGVEYSQPDNAKSYDLNTLTGPLWDRAGDYPFTLWEDGTGEYNAGSDTRKELTGLMDDVRIYNKALTQEEIAALFNN